MSAAYTRRRFVNLVLLTGAGAALAPLLTAQAADLPLISEDDPTAKALGYHHDANAVDVKQYPRSASVDGVKPLCSNCALYQGDDSQGPCSIFPGKAVKAGGWCNAWAPKP
ncbi:MAG: hypothetical protein Tsb002_04400 [Wenzhouxiangellaceae bacterium]